MRLQRDSYAPKSCAFDAANVQFLRAHLCKSHPVLQQRFLFAEIFVFLRQMVLQFPLQGDVDEALSYDLHRFVEMSLR